MSLRILLSILFIYWTLLLLGQIQIYSNFFSIYLITALSHIDEEIDNWLRVFLSVPTPHSAKCMECNFAILAKSFLCSDVGFCKRCFPSMWQKTILYDEFTKFMKMQSNSLVGSGHTLKKVKIFRVKMRPRILFLRPEFLKSSGRKLRVWIFVGKSFFCPLFLRQTSQQSPLCFRALRGLS